MSKKNYTVSMETAFIYTHTDPYTRAIFAVCDLKDVHVYYNDLSEERLSYAAIPQGKTDLANFNYTGPVRLTATTASGYPIEQILNTMSFYTHACCGISQVSWETPEKPGFQIHYFLIPDHHGTNSSFYTIRVADRSEKIVYEGLVNKSELLIDVPEAGTYQVEVFRNKPNSEVRDSYHVAYVTVHEEFV